MAHTPRLVTSTMDYDAFLAAVNDLVQLKRDRRGAEVAALDTNTRAGASWFNMVDDALLALFAKTDDITATAAVVYDTRDSPTVTGTATSGGGTVDFEIDVTKERVVLDWIRVVSDDASEGGMVQLYADSARTKLVYESDIAAGDPPVASTEYDDGNPFTLIASDGTTLDDQVIYGTITNDGDTDSTYTVYIMGRGY